MRWEEEPWGQGKAGRVRKRGARRLHSNIPWAGDWGKDWTDGAHAASLPLGLSLVWLVNGG